MKYRILALLLLLALILTACASGSSMTKSGKDESNLRRSSKDGDEAGVVTDAGADIGALDGNSYINMALGFSVAFPEDWAVYSEYELAGLNELDAATFDRAAVADAVEAEQNVAIFYAAYTTGEASPSFVSIYVCKNPLPDADPDGDALVNHFLPLLKQEYARRDAYSLLASEPFDADFCGEDHVVLNLAIGNAEPTSYKTILYLPCGDLLYTLTVSTAREDTTADLLGLFEPLD